MDLNSQVWGTENNWQLDTNIAQNVEGAPAVYHGQYTTLDEYRTHDLVEFGTPIDNSIAYCGQAPNQSPWGDRAVYFWEGANADITPKYTYQNVASIALFDSAVELIYNLDEIYGIRGFEQNNDEWLTETGFTRWYDYGNINPRYPDDYKQSNLDVRPIVDFNPRAIFGVIYVVYFDENGSIQEDTLYNVEHSAQHNNYQIVYAYMRPTIVQSWTDENNNLYYTPIAADNKRIMFNALEGIKIGDKSICSYTMNSRPTIGFPLLGCDAGTSGMWYGIYRNYNSDPNINGKVKISWRNYHYNNNDKEWGDEMSAGLMIYGARHINVLSADSTTSTDYQYNSIYWDCPATSEMCENIRKLAACYGLFFTDNPTSTIYNSANRWDDNNMMLGLLRDGVGYGDYTRGTANANNPAYNWTNSHSSGYEPSKEVDPNIYSDTTNFNTLSLKNAFTRRYALTSAEVQQLAGKLWDANATKDPNVTMNEFTLDEYLTNNPIDCIVSLKYFPCKFFTDSALPLTPLYLGKYDTNMLVYGVDKEVCVLDFAPIMIFRHFGDFRDFEPYTQVQMYIPFCGTVSIPCAEAMGKYVAVKLVVDVSTGAASGFVLVSNSGSGGICVATATGTAAIDLPVSGLQSANLSQAIFNATANWTQTQISNGKISGGLLAQSDSFIGTIARGYSKSLGSGVANSAVSLSRGNLTAGVGILSALDPAKAIETGLKTDLENARANYDLHHVELPMRLIGSASPMLSAVLETVCRLVIYRPRTDVSALSSYADTVGYACCKSGVVSDFSGFTVGTIDVSGINATQEEKAAIAAAFASGVYL